MTVTTGARSTREGDESGEGLRAAWRETLREMDPAARRWLRFWSRLTGSLFLFFSLLLLVAALPGRSWAWLASAWLSFGLLLAGGLGVWFALWMRSSADSPSRSESTWNWQNWRWRRQPERFHRMQLVFPWVAVLTALCLGGALTLELSRFLREGGSVRYFALQFCSGLFLVALLFYEVGVNTRFVYRFGRSQAEARLALLQSQLHPHVLFNSLNTIAALVRTKPAVAEKGIQDLARVLRHSLDRSQRRLAPLAEETDFLRACLAIEELRWGERLRVEWQIDLAAMSCEVPPLVLQPLVENALKHGLSERLEGGTLVIGAALAERQLELWVADRGNGLAQGWKEGFGLRTLRERLAVLYGGAAQLELLAESPGTRAIVRIPLRLIESGGEEHIKG